MEKLSKLLRNVLYKGCISHKGAVYGGEQEAIVGQALWEQVQERLAQNGLSQRGARMKSKQYCWLVCCVVELAVQQ